MMPNSEDSEKYPMNEEPLKNDQFKNCQMTDGLMKRIIHKLVDDCVFLSKAKGTEL